MESFQPYLECECSRGVDLATDVADPTGTDNWWADFDTSVSTTAS